MQTSAKIVLHDVQNAQLWPQYVLAFQAIKKVMEEVRNFTCEAEMTMKCTEYVQTLSSSLFMASLRKQMWRSAIEQVQEETSTVNWEDRVTLWIA